eukprot:g6412.t1
MAAKGLMLSERPPPSVMTSGAGASASGVGMAASAPGVKIGNYKGVMLCNRPFAGVAATAKAAQKGGPAPFVTGVPTEKVGSSVPISKRVVSNRSKKHTALSRHKKWLHELQSTKEKLEREMTEEEDAKADRRARFMERERQMRQAVRGMEDDEEEVDEGAVAEAKDGGEGAERSGAKEGKGGPRADEAKARDAGRAEAKAAAPAKAAAQAKGAGARPKWAMTEEQAEKADEDQEDEEAERLLDFASSLDFDKYIDDMEVRAMMEQVKNTVDELESAIAEEEAEDEAREARDAAAAEGAEGAEATVSKEAAPWEEGQAGELTEGNLSKLGGSAAASDDDGRSVAESLLSQAESLRSVHSKRSIAKLTEKARERVQAETRQSKLDAIAEEREAAPPLRVVVHNEEPTRLTKKLDPSNLPYMHRNPAV